MVYPNVLFPLNCLIKASVEASLFMLTARMTEDEASHASAELHAGFHYGVVRCPAVLTQVCICRLKKTSRFGNRSWRRQG